MNGSEIRGWLLFATASVALHGGAVAAVGLLPERPRPSTTSPPITIAFRTMETPSRDEIEVEPPEEETPPAPPSPPRASTRKHTGARRTRPPATAAPRRPEKEKEKESEDETSSPTEATEPSRAELLAAAGVLRSDRHPPEPSVPPPSANPVRNVAPPDPPMVVGPRPSGSVQGEDVRHRLRRRRDGGYDFRDTEFSAIISPDGTVTFRDKPVAQRFTGLGIDADVTDEVMRSVGDDPYRYEKRKFLIATRELRESMADRYLAQNLKSSLQDLLGRLEAIWEDSGRPAAERRRKIFRLWDECLEEGDPRRVEVARRVRRAIEAFVREHLPAGTRWAFEDEELDLLNRSRSSRARFDPYEGGTG